MSQQDIASQPVQELQPTSKVIIPGYAWVVLVVVFLASMVAPLNQFKVPPLMPVLMEAFQLDLTMAGLLMSIFALTGFILAIPAGFILQSIGPKITGLIAVGCVVLGSAIGALSTTAGLLLTSRVIEGIGMGLITVVAPAVIAMWFPAEARGTPMGIWATWVPVGSIIMYNLAPALGTAVSWQAVWWAGAAFALVAFVLYWALLRMPQAPEESTEPSESAEVPPVEAPPSLGRAMANVSIWLLSLEFCCFNIVFLAFSTFAPTFLVSVRGYSLAVASFLASLIMIITIGSCPLGGWISDRIGSRKLVYTIPFIIVALMWVLPFSVTGWMITAFMIVVGILAGAIPTATFAAVPEVMVKPQLAGIGMAVLALGQNLGMFIGPVMFGKFVESMGWVAAGYLLIPICVIGIIAGWFVKVR